MQDRFYLYFLLSRARLIYIRQIWAILPGMFLRAQHCCETDIDYLWSSSNIDFCRHMSSYGFTGTPRPILHMLACVSLMIMGPNNVTQQLTKLSQPWKTYGISVAVIDPNICVITFVVVLFITYMSLTCYGRIYPNESMFSNNSLYIPCQHHVAQVTYITLKNYQSTYDI